MSKGITETNMQLMIWILLGVVIVGLLIYLALTYLNLLPFKVTWE